MTNYYKLDNVIEFVRNKRIDGIYTDCKVTGLCELEFWESQQLQGYTVAFTLTLKDSKKQYKGKRLKVLTVMNWFSFQDLEFSNEALTEWFDNLLGV